MKEFFTKEAQEEGVSLPLTLPDGTATEHWIKIRGADSDAFRVATTEARRQAFDRASRARKGPLAEDAVDIVRTNDDARIAQLASLIIGWSFEQPCTDATKRELLIKAPQIADAIDKASADRALFWKSRLTGSQPTPPQSSN